MTKKIEPIVITAIIFFVGCSENITGPEQIHKPGKRDYLWTIDTLNVSGPSYKIWGSSPTDVWAINGSDYNNSIYHFNGVEWSTDGVFRLVYPWAIWGFSKDNVYIGGAFGGKIWNFDGNEWREVAVLKDGNDNITIENIWGESSKNFYATGSKADDKGYANESIIAHFKSNNWAMLNTGALKGSVVHLYKNKPDGMVYLQTIITGGLEHPDSTLIYSYKGDEFNKLYGSLYSQGQRADISIINNEVYFILGNEISKRKSGQFQAFIDVNNLKFYHRIWGRNSKDIFLLMTDGLVHYNGTDMEYLFHFKYPNNNPATQIFSAAIFEKEMFFVTYEPPTGLKYIYHGELFN